MCSSYESSLETPIGSLKISCCAKGVHSICICEKENSSTFNNVLETVDGQECLIETLKWLTGYFEGQVTAKPPEVCQTVLQSRGPFTQSMWLTLKDAVPAGGTVTYGGLAEMCGRSKGAARAVGTAMRTNPVPLLVPCHRVVKGGGALGRYSGGGGAPTKQWLIRHEEAAVAAAQQVVLHPQRVEFVAQRAELNSQRAILNVRRA